MSTNTSTSKSPSVDSDEEQPRRRRKPWSVAVVVLAVILGGYAAAGWLLGDRVPRGATVAGVDIGGLTTQAATDRLANALAEPAVEPVPVTLGDSQTTLDPQAATLEVDAAATVDELTGLSFDPRSLLRHIVGTVERDPVTLVRDADALRTELTRVAAILEVPPVNGEIELTGGEAEVTEAADGLALDVEAAMAEVPEQWLAGPYPVELPGSTITPEITADVVSTAMEEIAGPLTGAPIAVEIDDSLIELSPEDLTSVAAIEPSDGSLVLELDGEALVDMVIERDPEVRAPARDAQIVIEDDTPTIIPGDTGVSVDEEDLVAAVTAAAVAGSDRTVAAPFTEIAPQITSADIEALGVTEMIAEFSTPFHDDPERTENLRVGAGHITDTLVLPGDTFSLIEALGPITTERGYVSSGVVVDGLETEGMGGGLSQVSTTVFNAAYFAGMEFVEFQTHSHHYARYPEGREATMYTPSVDLQWRNTTPHGALMQAWVSDGQMHVRLWGTEHFAVESQTGDRYDFTDPSTVYNSAPDCVPHSSPERGFTVDVTRTVSHDGEQVTRNTSTTTYIPWDRVVCGPAPDEDD